MRILLSANHVYPAFNQEGVGLRTLQYPSGSGNHVHDLLARGLAEAGHEVFYLLRNGWSRKPPPGVHPVSNPILDVDLYHSVFIPGINEDVSRLLCSQGKPWLATCALDRSQIGPPSGPNWIFVSASLARAHGRSRYVWDGIDPADCFFAESKQDYFLFISAMDNYEKGLDTALELSQHHSFRLVVAGSARKQEIIEEVSRRCRAAGAEYVGDVRGKRKAELIGQAKALLFTSRLNEGCPLVIIEALMSGTPVISSAVGGCVEMITPDTGFLCRTAADFSYAVENVHRIDPLRCRNAALKNFHYRKMTAEYLREYETEIAETRKIPGGALA